jgi:hypothetical protein
MSPRVLSAPERTELWRVSLPERLSGIRLLIAMTRGGLVVRHRYLARRLAPLQRQLSQLARQAAADELELPLGQWLDVLGDGLMTIQEQLAECASEASARGLSTDRTSNLALRDLATLLREASARWRALLEFWRGAA